ncbi:hypothetical protein BD413DRAFT_588560 [Trametes elegans]|nr:hypothetical protein BD413DRAFT_588560 [Trametes elegans]
MPRFSWRVFCVIRDHAVLLAVPIFNKQATKVRLRVCAICRGPDVGTKEKCYVHA